MYMQFTAQIIWFKDKLMLFSSNTSKCPLSVLFIYLDKVVAKIVRTPDRSENTDLFCLQNVI